jgi:hypothetical protein
MSKKITPTQAIKAFLTEYTRSDLASLYSYGMECQVNVSQDEGDRVQKVVNGKTYYEFTDGVQTWKPIRIPRNAATKPEYSEENREMQFDLLEHAEAIGMTGWDWQELRSKWVVFDFDGLVGHADSHSAKITPEELEQVKEAACSLSYITVRKSTSGTGLHLYVFLDVSIATHTEHAALARAVLSMMSADAGYDFAAKADVCGGNFWIWHSKMAKDGYELIKKGIPLTDIPPNWKDHVPVIKGAQKKTLPQFDSEHSQNLFEQITEQRTKVKFDKEHKKLLEYLKKGLMGFWYESDKNMIVAHTSALKKAHKDLGLRGVFDTVSKGKDQGDWNCFAFPLATPPGAWVVRRYSLGVQEKSNWKQDPNGYTISYFNCDPSTQIAARTTGGVENEKGEFHFTTVKDAKKAAKQLGIDLDLPPQIPDRKAKIKEHKDGRLVVSIKSEDGDNLDGWLETRGWWQRIFESKSTQVNDSEPTNFDKVIRHLIDTEGNDRGWVLKSPISWNNEPLTHIKVALKTLGISAKEIDLALGQSVIEGWRLINIPFGPEYPGNREWNRSAVQFTYNLKKELPFNCPTWDKIFDHVGAGLNEAVNDHEWCKVNEIITGSDYLKLWVASLFQEPRQHLPYLFLYSKEQQTGKSTLHEALSLLITRNGYARADTALISQSAFNAELEYAVLCVIQETDLRKGIQARNRIKDWVNSPLIPIHRKGQTPYLAENTTHFVHTANDPAECPIFPGDDRITVGYVGPIDPEKLIPKKELFLKLKREAPAFMAIIMGLKIPPCKDRLNIPVITSQEKIQSAQANRNPLEIFLDEMVFYVPGKIIKFSEFCDRFFTWIDSQDSMDWSKIRIGKSLPRQYPKGRCLSKQGQFYIGNVSWERGVGGKILVLKNGELI